jgi:glycosyltransferase involved in cell wall biosynthesis
MRLLFLSQLFDPEYSIKGLDFLSSMRADGFDVTVVTTFPSYPTGKIYPGYKAHLWQVEVLAGIEIIRVYSFISQSKSKLARALSYGSFMVSASIAILFLKRRPNLVYAYHPQLTTGLIASFYKFIWNVPFVTDVQDLWPDALTATKASTSKLVSAVVGSLCSFVYRNSNHIVTLSNGYKAALIDRGVPEEKISVVYNWCNERAPEHMQINVPLPSDSFKHTFVYAGNLGAAQSIRTLVSAFSELNDQSICLLIFGSGVERQELVDYSRAIGARNVFFLGHIQSSEINGFLQRADVLIAHLRDEPVFEITVPSKTQAYLFAGKPILMAVRGEAAELIRNAKAGVCAEPQNPSSIAAAATSLVSDRGNWGVMGENGIQFYKEKMSMRVGVAKIAALLESINRKSAPRAR